MYGLLTITQAMRHKSGPVQKARSNPELKLHQTALIVYKVLTTQKNTESRARHVQNFGVKKLSHAHLILYGLLENAAIMRNGVSTYVISEKTENIINTI